MDTVSTTGKGSGSSVMAQPGLVKISATEIAPLRTVMRDLQRAVAAYYAETARVGTTDALGSHVRAFLNHVQTLNDYLTNSVSDRAAYDALFTSSPRHQAAGLINAVRYARNVVQHVLYIVRPADDGMALIGGTHGMRVYAKWDEVPAQVHAQLRKATQALKPDYDTNLYQQDVTRTMLEVLKFFADVSPGIVDRDRRNEWTGSPLQEQPGVLAALHPEEPLSETDARAWLDSRPPNGDARVVCGQLAVEGTRYVVGFTFADSVAFSVFVETTEQVERDMAAGFTYLIGDVAANIEDCSPEFPSYRLGPVFRSTSDLTEWASAFDPRARDADWDTAYDLPTWTKVVVDERSSEIASGVTYSIRRARRLNAYGPPRT